jgi:hypothetical protein
MPLNDYPEPASICDRCNQLCFWPTTVHYKEKDLRICWSCFEAAVIRSGGTVISDLVGGHTILRGPRP